MEPVWVWRGRPETDPYGNPDQGDPQPWRRFEALVAPANLTAPFDVGRAPLVTGFTLYIRGTDPTGILSTDLVELRSPVAEDSPVAERRAHLLRIEGEVASWRSSRGLHRGDQLSVKGVTG